MSDQTLELVQHEDPAPADLTMRRPPAVVLEEARQAARAVAEVIEANQHKVILGGRQYLQFSDWQVLGRFYGIAAKVISTEYVELGDTWGFVAKAVAVRADGMEISAAEASCASDEPKWANRPLFQLRSMAQTRAAAKCLRNVLSFVPILAGFADTPAEEMDDEPPKPKAASKRIIKTRWDAFKVLREAKGWSREQVKQHVEATYHREVPTLTPAQFEELAAYVESHPRAAAEDEQAF